MIGIIALLLTSHSFADVIVRVDHNESVQSERIFVMDIASCDGPVDACADLRSIYLGASPRVGDILQLDLHQLREIIKTEGLIVDLQGPEKVRVRRAETTVSKAEVQAAIEAKLKQWTSSTQDPMRLTALRFSNLKDIRIPKSDYLIVIRDEWNQNLMHQISRSRMLSLDIVHSKDERLIERFRVGVSAHIERNTLVARRDIKANVAIAHEDLEYQWLPLQRTSLNEQINLKDAIGLVLRTPVKKGQSLRSSLLEPMQSVRRGDLVKLRLISKGGTELNGEAKALSSGAVGKEIRVLYAKTKKTLQALVIGEGLVEVRL